MGCGGSAFPEDAEGERKWLSAEVDATKNNYIDKSLLTGDVIKFTMKRNISRVQEDCAICSRDAGSKELLSIKSIQGRKRISKGGEPLATLVINVRDSEVNGIDATLNLPHLYIYSYKPYRDGQSPSEFVEEEKPLFHWARIDKRSNATYSVSLAEHFANDRENVELFGMEKYQCKTLKDSRLVIKDKAGQGACCVGFLGEDQYAFAVARTADPVVMISVVICVEVMSNQY